MKNMSEFETGNQNKFQQQEWDIIQYEGNTLLVQGDALCGKTHTYLGRIAYLAKEKEVSFTRMLNLCADTKACEDALARYRQSYLEEEELPSFVTLHAFAYRIIKRDAREKGKDCAKPYRSLHAIMKKIALEKFGVELRYGELEWLNQQITEIKSMMLPQKEIDARECSFLPFAPFYKAYEAAKKKQNVMDYGDLITEALTILMNEEAIRLHYQQIYRYIHIDQGETLSFAGHLLLRALCAPDTKLVLFANPSLALTSKGAYPDGLKNFTSTYQDAVLMELETPYLKQQRKDVLDLFQKKLSKEEWSGEDEELVCKAFADPSRLYTYAKKQWTQKEYSVFAYRHAVFALPLIDDLQTMGVGAMMEGNFQSFFQDAIIKELLDMMRLLIDPKDARVFSRIYKVFEVNDKTAKEILMMMQEEDMDVFEAMIRSSLKATRKKELMSQMELIRILPKKDSVVMIKGILSRMGYEKRLKELRVRRDDANLIILKLMAQRYPNAQTFTERMEFLSTLELDYDPHVKILPVSRIQGKRFDSVSVLDCIMSSFPSPYGQMEEERILFANLLKYSTHLELFSFRTVYDLRTEISSFIFDVHKKKEESKAVIRTIKKVDRVSEVHLKPRTRIVHETLGSGVIERVQDGMIHVNFDNEEKRSLNIKFCLNNDLIKLA